MKSRHIEKNRKKAKPISIEKGSVIAIPLEENVWALGQIIIPGIIFYMGVGLQLFSDSVSAPDINSTELKLFSWTNDAELYKGRWKNLGVYDLKEIGRLPEYKVSEGGVIVVKSFLGDNCRNFDPDADRDLQYRTSRSPLLVEDAVRAACGMGAWKPYYERMMR